LNCGSAIQGGIAVTSASASSLNGVLRSSSTTSFTFSGFGDVTAGASARWDDQAFVIPIVAGPAANHLELAFGVTGSTGVSGPDLYGSFSDVAGYRAVGNFGALAADEAANPFRAGISSGSNYNADLPDATLNSTVIFSLLLDASGSSSPFWYGVDTYALAYRYLADPVPLVGTAGSDFSHTIVPLYYRVLDANNNDVTSNYQVAFAEGLTFGADATPVTTPEPSSMALLGTGLVGLVGFRNGRRKSV
jgi:hypothetical protein